MTDATLPPGPLTIQKTPMALAVVSMVLIAFTAYDISIQKGLLFGIGIILGLTLYHAAFGFTGAYKRALTTGDISGVLAQIIMLIVAMLLFWPLLSDGEAFGHQVGGAVAPVGVAMGFGALLFGIGMQWAGGCASGTLFTAGGGSVRMVIVLIAFCLGAFFGSLHLSWWQTLPGIGAVSLAKELGWPTAISLQVGLLALVVFVLFRLGGRLDKPLWPKDGCRARMLLTGPWPLLLAALILAAMNAATVAVAGHPWSVTWGFTLWGAKMMQAIGWDAATSSFWSGSFTGRALATSVFNDTVSLMNFGIIVGSFLGASLAGRLKPTLRIPVPAIASAILGGLMLGYGARLAYGCNIGAFFSGIASTSLHGWVWIVCAIIGNIIGLRLKSRIFGQIG